MALQGTYEPSPSSFAANQVAEYEASGGREANTLRGVPIVILWTRGRRSGAIRKTPLMRVNDGDRYAVVASQGGAPEHPEWYRNVEADPHVALQDGPVVRSYVAHTASPEEKAEWWPKATAVWPDYDAYQGKTDREIPLVILEPA
jgi:deazaflavin-dependent oxidoreductase (nitroreductase family)